MTSTTNAPPQKLGKQEKLGRGLWRRRDRIAPATACHTNVRRKNPLSRVFFRIRRDKMSGSQGAGPTPRAKGPSNFERRVDTISRVFQKVAEGRRVSQQQCHAHHDITMTHSSNSAMIVAPPVAQPH